MMLIAAIDWSDEISKAAITFVFVALLGGAAGVLWARARHRRELDSAALARFYDVYGMWLATWRSWSGCKGGKIKELNPGELVRQAAAAEGQFEALLIKIVNERRLSLAERDRLGRFREGYQQLRKSIEDDEELAFRVTRDNERTAYAAFKSLAVEFAALLDGRRRAPARHPLSLREMGRRPTLEQAQVAFAAVTGWQVSPGALKESWWKDFGGESVENTLAALESFRREQRQNEARL